MKFRKILTFTVLSSLTLSLTAFAGEAESHYDIGVTWLPAVSSTADSWGLVGFGVGENVFLQDAEGNLYSNIVENVVKTGDLTWELTLKDGIQFSDGSDVTADLFCESLNACMENNGGTGTCGTIAFEKKDDKTILATTERPTPVLQSALCEMSYVVYKEDGATGIYTGPYMIEDQDPGVTMDLIPNPYFDENAEERPSITVHQFSDNTSMTQAFESGDLDYVNALTPDAANDLKEEGYTVIDYDGAYQYFAILNLSRTPLDDRNVREAIALAMDRDEMVEALYGCLPATGFFGRKFTFNADIAFEKDLDKAAELLKEAGYEDSDGDGYVDKDGENLTFEITTYNMHPELPTMMQVMVSQLDKIGINITTNILDGGMDKFASEGNYDIILYGGYTGNTSDPAAKLNAFFRTGDSTNYNGYTSEEVDQMLDELDTTDPGEERDALAIRIQEKVAEDLPVIYLIDSEFHGAADEALAGYRPYGGDYYIINDSFGLS